VGAPSSLALATALRFKLTLVGFLRGAGFNVYSSPERLKE
jgi:FdhD protein